MNDPQRIRRFEAVLIGLFAFGASPVFAEGGIGFQPPDFVPGTEQVQSSKGSGTSNAGFGQTYSWAATTVDVSASNYSFTGTVDALGYASNAHNNVENLVLAGGSGSASGSGSAGLTVANVDMVQSFSKGPFSIILGESSLYATVTVNGRQYLVAKELAVALSRATPNGNSASTYVSATTVDGGAYTSTQVNVSKSGH